MANNTAAEAPQIDGYEVLGVLGEGGSGTVYAAHANGRDVALKVLRADQAPTGKECRRWLREAEHMAKLRHSGVVQIYGSGQLPDGRPYLAMERVAGTNLAARIARGRLPVDAALALFDQLAAAVAAIHDAGLIHRDIKPENVMLVEGGERVVLLDFGIAQHADAPPSTTTQEGFRRGTPAVMAPERFFGERASMLSDIYELGVLLFVMLTGGLPWRTVLDAQARLNPMRPSDVGVTLPPGIEATLMRALETDPTRRPASALELGAELRRAGWDGATVNVRSKQSDNAAASGPTVDMRAKAPTENASEGLSSATTPSVSTRFAVPAALVAGVVLVIGGGAFALLSGSSTDRGRDAAAQPLAGASERIELAPSKIAPTPLDAQSSQVDSGAPSVAGADLSDAGTADVGIPAGRTSRALARRAPASRNKPAKNPPVNSARAGAQVLPVSAPASRGTSGIANNRNSHNGPGGTSRATRATRVTMPWCTKQAELYCTEKFKRTEGGLAGEQCKRFNKLLRGWKRMAPTASSSIETFCKKNYATFSAAAAERMRMYDSGQSPGTTAKPK